jgi:ankyrin repeat protein
LLVAHGADINARDFNGNTLLHSICKGHLIDKSKILDAMLQLGVDVNQQNNQGQTCLHLLDIPHRDKGEADRVGAIIAAGADLEIRDREGMTVLLNAVAKNPALAEVLLRQPKLPSLSARMFLKGKTVLHLACQSKNPLGMIQLLVSKGADVNWTDNEGNTLLHDVAERFEGRPEQIALVEQLVKMCVPTNARNSRQQMAVHLIAPVYATGPINEMGPVAGPSRQSLVSVFTRLDPHFDVNAQDIDGYTALHFASTASETETFNLIQCGADLNAKAFNLRTPLHCASRGRQSGIISMLLHFGKQSGKLIDINAADVDGRTPLHDACRSGRPESVSLLVAAGADIQREDKASNTPLMACAEFMEEDKVWSLMKTKRGQPTISTGISIQDPFRGTPAARDPTQLQPYRESFHQDATRVGVIAKMLIKAGADTDGARRAASSYRNGQLVAALHQESTANGKLWYGDFVENSLLMPSHNAAVILENYKSDGPINDTVRHVDHIDEATIDALLARGIDFTKPARDGDDGTPIAKIARLGMTELMDKIIEKAKLFDDPAFSQSVAEAVHAGYARVRPLLQVACARKVWNMGMVKLLVVEGLVDGNAHKQVKQMQNGRETGSLVPGSTSLHVLAEGDFWWQVEAVKYLIEKGL